MCQIGSLQSTQKMRKAHRSSVVARRSGVEREDGVAELVLLGKVAGADLGLQSQGWIVKAQIQTLKFDSIKGVKRAICSQKIQSISRR